MGMFDCRHSRLLHAAECFLMEETVDAGRDEKRSSVAAYVMIEGAQKEQSSDCGPQQHDSGS
jgi:hypothetical protein